LKYRAQTIIQVITPSHYPFHEFNAIY